MAECADYNDNEEASTGGDEVIIISSGQELSEPQPNKGTAPII